MLKKNDLRSLRVKAWQASLGAIGFMAVLCGGVQPAAAGGIPVMDALAIMELQKLNMAMMGFASVSAGQGLQSNATNAALSNVAADARLATVFHAPVVSMAWEYYREPSSSALYVSPCASAMSVALRAKRDQKTAALTAAFSAANAGSKGASPATEAKQFKEGCALFGARDGVEGRLSCTPTGDAKNARRDRTMEAILGYTQYKAPRDMAKPTTSGVYQPFPGFASGSVPDDYIPIAAAFNFCRYISPRTQGVPNVSTRTAETIRQVISQPTREALDSGVTGNCWKFFAERIQFPNGSSNFQADHDEQEEICLVDYDLYVIGQNKLTDCQTYGRSDLQAAFDIANRLGEPRYNSDYFATLKPDTVALVKEAARDAPQQFKDFLEAERKILTDIVLKRSGGGSEGFSAALPAQ